MFLKDRLMSNGQLLKVIVPLIEESFVDWTMEGAASSLEQRLLPGRCPKIE